METKAQLPLFTNTASNKLVDLLNKTLAMPMYVVELAKTYVILKT